MPNWTGDDGVSDYKGADEPCLPTPLDLSIVESIHLKHQAGSETMEMDVIHVTVCGVQAYVVQHDDLNRILVLAGERLKEKARKRGSKKRRHRDALYYPKDKKRRAPRMKRSLTRAQVARKMKGAQRRG